VEADRLKTELLKARLAEKEAKEKLLQFLSQPAIGYPGLPMMNLNFGNFENMLSVIPEKSPTVSMSEENQELSYRELFDVGVNSGSGMNMSMSVGNGVELDPLTLEIEKERVEYLEKSKCLQEQLRDLKKEIEGLKLDEKQTPFDVLHREQVLSGENKYSTLRKIKSGSTKSRVAFFEEL